jgi:cell division cycle 2-like protein
MWSVGCIFAELMTTEPLFPGKNETDQIGKIFKILGQPTSDSWPEFNTLPNAKNLNKIAQPFSTLRQRFRYSTENCLDLLSKLLTYDPLQRITADEALKHPYFEESPAPAHPDSFGSFPSVAAGEKKRNSPNAPERLADQKLAYQLEMDL